jgi:hypothetical protein
MAMDTILKWTQRASPDADYEYLISIDDDDPKYNLYHEWLYKIIGDKIKLHVNMNKNAIEAINRVAHFGRGDVFIIVSDDFECPHEWDKLLSANLFDKTDFVAKVNDGTPSWIVTLPIVHKEFYNRFEYIYNPEYQHMFCDTEMTCVAGLLGKLIYLDHLGFVFPHKHYTQPDGMKKDEVNEKNDSTWIHGESVFRKRINENFGLKPEEVVSKKILEKLAHWL